MTEKTTSIINQNIQSTYHIDQQIEKKEEMEREETKERHLSKYTMVAFEKDFIFLMKKKKLMKNLF